MIFLVFCRHLSSQRRFHGVVNLGSVSKTIWRSNSLSSSVLSTAGLLGALLRRLSKLSEYNLHQVNGAQAHKVLKRAQHRNSRSQPHLESKQACWQNGMGCVTLFLSFSHKKLVTLLMFRLKLCHFLAYPLRCRTNLQSASLSQLSITSFFQQTF